MKHLHSTCVLLAFLAAAIMALGPSLPAQSAKSWAAVPSTISAWQSISPTNSLAHAGSMFMLSVMASDFDYWIEPPNTGSSADTCTYAWSTDSGSVSGAVYVSWTLAADAKGLCSCTVVVDDVATIWPPDTGNRNDDLVRLTKQVGVPTSEVDITTCASTAAGLHEIQYTTTTYSATQQSLVLEYRENNSPYVTDWAAIPESPVLQSTTTDAHSVETKTYKVMWNTLPLHNSHYEVRLRAEYTWGCHSETQNRQTTERGVDVNNLNISGSSPVYLKWLPGSVSPQAISATLSDGLNLTDTTVTIKIYNSNRTTYPNPLRTRTSTGNSSNVSYQWDGKNDAGVDCPAGVYIYTISASQIQPGGEDKISDTSSSGQITGADATDPVQALYIRTVCNTVISDGRLIVIKPELNELENRPANTPYGPYATLTVVGSASYNPTMAGDYTCLLVGNDNSTVATDKAHTARKALGFSFVERAFAVNVYVGPVNQTPTLPYTSEIGTAWHSLVNKLCDPTSGNRRYKFEDGWQVYPTNQYNPGTYPAIRQSEVVLSGMRLGQPIGPVAPGQPSATTNNSSVVWVLYSHGEPMTNPTELAVYCSDTATQRLRASDISASTNTGTVEINRLAVILACNAIAPSTNSFATVLSSRGWNVICSSQLTSAQIVCRYSQDFKDVWSQAGYRMDTLKKVHEDTNAQLWREAAAEGWPSVQTVHIDDLYFTARQ